MSFVSVCVSVCVCHVRDPREPVAMEMQHLCVCVCVCEHILCQGFTHTGTFTSLPNTSCSLTHTTICTTNPCLSTMRNSNNMINTSLQYQAAKRIDFVQLKYLEAQLTKNISGKVLSMLC